MMEYQHQVFGLGSVTRASSNMYAAVGGGGFVDGMDDSIAGQHRMELVDNFRARGNMVAWSKANNKKGYGNMDVSVEDPIQDDIGPPAFAHCCVADERKKPAKKSKIVQIDEEED